MKFLKLVKKHFKNINLIDYYFEKYYIDFQRFYYKSLFVNLKETCFCSNKYSENEIVVSLTTYGERINSVYLTITSLIHQTIKANRIVLWLSEVEYCDEKLPQTLRKLKDLGLEIRYCEDIKSYKKIIPTLNYYPNSDIITVDDDVIYPVDFIEKLLSAHISNPNKVCFTRGCKILFDKRKHLLPYRKWQKASNEKSMLNIPTGVGGVLYPKGCFYNDVVKKEIFMNLCPNGDDLWLRVMCLINNVDTCYLDCYKYFSHYFIEIENSQETSLNSINNSKQSSITNDSQFASLITYYRLEKLLYDNM